MKWSDIHGWSALGQRWAAALDGNGQVIAIYDLSYPEIFGRLPLGRVGGKKLSVLNLNGRVQATRSGDSVFADEWWKKIPWKRSNSWATAPSRFSLSDIDLVHSSKSPRRFQELLNHALSKVNPSDEGNLISSDFLEHFFFERQADGRYEISYSAVGEGVSRPKKLADLWSPKVGLWEAWEWEGAGDALSEAGSLIPDPYTRAFFETAIDRFFHFHELMAHSQENFLVERLNELQDSSQAPSWMNLAIKALEYSQSTLTNGWEWIFKKPLNEWQKLRDQQRKYEAQSTTWLERQGESLQPFNPRFALGSDVSDGTRIFLMAYGSPGKKGPYASVDRLHPDLIRDHRIETEALVTDLLFGANFIPVFGGSTVADFLIGLFLEDPIDRKIVWEARLASHLEEDGDFWAADLAILDQQRINPLMPPRDEMLELIAERRKLIGL